MYTDNIKNKTIMEELAECVYTKSKTLREASLEIDASLEAFENELKERRLEDVQAYEDATNDLKDASAQGDRSENAEFTTALEKLQQLRSSISNIDAQLKSITVDLVESEYVSIGMIVMYTTFLLKDNKNEIFVFKMYPENVSDIDRCILAKNSRLGSALWLKKKEDKVEIEDSITGEKFTYEILDIY